MINVKGISYQVLAVTEKKVELNITNAVQSLGWEENENELAMKISMDIINAKYKGDAMTKLLKIGCVVAVKAKAGGKNSIVAFGRITEVEATNVSGKQIFKITAYDCLYDMQKSQDNVYYASGKKTEAIFRDIFKKWGIPVGSYHGPNVKHGKILYKNKGLAEILRGILDEAKKKKGGKGMIRSEKNKVSVVTVGSNTDVYVFTNKNTTTSKYKRSTADMITRVKIVGPSKEKEKAKVEATVNGKTKYGIRQKIVTRSKSDSMKDAKKEAQEILDENGSVKDTRTIISPDVPFVRKGDKVNLDASLAHGDYIVKSVQHNADKRQMTMEVEALPAKTSSSGNGKKAKTFTVTARNGLNLRKSPNGKIILTVPHGKKVTSDGKKKSGWNHCKYSGKWGYMYAKYLK